MPDFKNLQALLEMDYSQMRALSFPGGMCATDEAITLFVDNLNAFFSQFTHKPTAAELRIYQTYMEQITDKINESEYIYYLAKYSAQYPKEEAAPMAACCKLNSFKKIPSRMQYWAASEAWGDSVRNAKEHVQAVKQMEIWADWLSENKLSFFNTQKENRKEQREEKQTQKGKYQSKH